MLPSEVKPEAYQHTFEAKEDDTPAKTIWVDGYSVLGTNLSDAKKFAQLATDVKNSEDIETSAKSS